MGQTSGASPSAEKPFFRYDLQTTPVEEGGQRFVDVSCPDTGSSFRFFEVEYAVACGMDGERGLAELVDWAKAELDLRTDTSEVGAIVSKLSELNFVEATTVAAAATPEVAADLPSVSADAPSADEGFGDDAPTRVPGPDTPAPEAPKISVEEAPALAPPPSRPAPVPAPAPLAASAGDELEVELGQSGRSPLQPSRPAPPAKGDELELGLAGASNLPPSRPEKKPESGIELGAAGFEEPSDFPEPSREVSTDLSQTFRIDKGAVQDAVRASKVMSAVDVPADLKAEMDKLGLSESADKLSPAGNDDLEFQIGEEAKTSTGREAIVLPEEPAQIAKREAAEAAVDKAVAAASKAKEKKKAKSAPVAKERSASLVLWAILLLAVAGGAGYYYMEYVREQPSEVGASSAAQQMAQVAAAPEPVKPVAPTANLQVGEAIVSEAKASQAGIVSEVVAPGSEVAEGEALIKLKGYERYQRDLDRHQNSLDQYAARLEAAKASDDTGKIADLESNVKRKEGDVAEATAKRDAFFVKAEQAGVAEVLVDARARVKPGQSVAKVTGQAPASVSFELPEGMSAAIDDELRVIDTGDEELSASCTVTEVAGQSITLNCPADSGLAADAELKLDMN